MCFILLLEICFISTLENFFLVLGLWNYYMFRSFWFEYGETNFCQIVIFCCLKNVFIIYMDSAPWKLFGHYDCGTIICFGVFDLNMAKQILVKLWFLVVGNMFLLYVWIQHPGKPLEHRDCGEFTIQICNSNKFLPNSKQILKENISRKNTKKYVMAYIFLNSRPGMLIAISLKILLVIWQEVVRSQDSNVRICKYVKSSCWWTISVIPK